MSDADALEAALLRAAEWVAAGCLAHPFLSEGGTVYCARCGCFRHGAQHFH